MRTEKPTKPWAERHGVGNWDACLVFLEQSRSAAIKAKEKAKAAAKRAEREKAIRLEEKERRQKHLLAATGVIATAILIAGGVIFFLWKRAQKSEKKAEIASANIVAASASIIEISKGAISVAEQRADALKAAIEKAATGAPLIREATDEMLSANNAAKRAGLEFERLAKATQDAAETTKDAGLRTQARGLNEQFAEVRERREALQRSPETWAKVEASILARLKAAEEILASITSPEPSAAAIDPATPGPLLRATAELAWIDGIQKAAFALGFERYDYKPFSQRIAAIDSAITASAQIHGQASTAPKVAVWRPSSAVELAHADKVNRVRFAPKFPDGAPLIVSACEDRQLWFWARTGKPLGVGSSGWHAMKDVALSPEGDAAAGGNSGAVVVVFRWTSRLAIEALDFRRFKADAFKRHTDIITDVEFSHGAERIVSSSADRTVRVFNSRTMTQLYYTDPPLPGIVTSVTFHRGDNLVVSGCDDGGVRLHTIDKPGVRLLGKFEAPARRPEFSYDGRLVVAASGDKSARVWSITEPGELARVNHPVAVTQATFRPVIDPEGYTFITTATNGEVRLVRLTEVSQSSAKVTTEVLKLRHPSAAVFATWSADGQRLATVGGGEVIVWEWAVDRLAARIRCVNLHPATSHAEFSPDARFLVSYGGDHLAYVWDLTKRGGVLP